MSYLPLLIVSFLGLPLGWFLYRITDEEVEKFRRSLIFVREMAAMVAIALLIVFVERPLVGVVLAAAYLVFRKEQRPYLYYALLAIILWLSTSYYLPYFASLTFLYGLLHGSLVSKSKGWGEAYRLVRTHSLFLIVGLALWLVSYFLL